MTSNHITTKSLLQSHRQCTRRAWLEANGTVQPEFTAAAESMMAQGQRVHAAARAPLVDAVTIPSHLGLPEAAKQTRRAMDGGARTIIEAAFVAGDNGVRVDVLRCDPDGVHITEIKSGASVHDAYLDDVSIQWACVEAAGLTIKSAAVQHPDTSLVLDSELGGHSVMTTEDVTDTVRWRSVRVAAWISECKDTIEGTEPECSPGPQCSDPLPCPFSAHCGTVAKSTDNDRVAYLPSKSGPVADCIAAGITKITSLPGGAFGHARNALLGEAVNRDVIVVRDAFRKMVAGLGYPRSFIDFETAAPALPLHHGMRPFEPLPFQWSCHQVARQGEAARASWFLDTDRRDPRRAFCESLLETVGTVGPVLVYSSYEQTRLRELAARFPDLAPALLAVVARLVDLLPLARRGFYAPAQRGSWSIKAILPTLPGAKEAGLCYDDLRDVNDGLSAQAAYLRLVDPANLGEDRAATREQMVRYCGVDTAGLLYFCNYVEGLASAPIALAA